MNRMGRVLAVATELGLAMGLIAAVMVIGGLFLGRWLDAQLGTNPIATLLFLIGGAVAGQLTMVRMARNASQQIREGGDWPQATRSAVGLALTTLALIIGPGLAGLVIGHLADRLLGTGVAVTIIAALAGIVAGLALTVRYVKKKSQARGRATCPSEER